MMYLPMVTDQSSPERSEGDRLDQEKRVETAIRVVEMIQARLNPFDGDPREPTNAEKKSMRLAQTVIDTYLAG